MPLSAEEKVRVRYHLGYPALSAGPSLSLGVPIDTPLMNLLQRAFDLILPEAEPMVRKVLSRCDELDDEIPASAVRLRAIKAEGVELNPNEPHALETEYMRQVARLSDLLHAPIYPFSERFQAMPSKRSHTGMIPVRHS